MVLYVQDIDATSANMNDGTHKSTSGSLAVNETSAFTLNLTDILNSRALLFHFMKFMEEEGSLNLLQFVLDCESLNEQLVRPESEQRRDRLLVQAQDMYRVCRNCVLVLGKGGAACWW